MMRVEGLAINKGRMHKLQLQYMLHWSVNVGNCIIKVKVIILNVPMTLQ